MCRENCTQSRHLDTIVKTRLKKDVNIFNIKRHCKIMSGTKENYSNESQCSFGMS